MKKTVFTICVLLLIFTVFSVAISAIDTPWLPLNPDSETTAQDRTETDGETTVQENSKTDGEKKDSNSGSKDDSTPNVNVLTDEDASQFSEQIAENETNVGKMGCGSVIAGGTILIASVGTFTVCIVKARKDNE